MHTAARRDWRRSPRPFCIRIPYRSASDTFRLKI
jgi:hypothetical protein